MSDEELKSAVVKSVTMGVNDYDTLLEQNKKLEAELFEANMIIDSNTEINIKNNEHDKFQASLWAKERDQLKAELAIMDKAFAEKSEELAEQIQLNAKHEEIINNFFKERNSNKYEIERLQRQYADVISGDCDYAVGKQLRRQLATERDHALESVKLACEALDKIYDLDERDTEKCYAIACETLAKLKERHNL